jgi:hypothetical protein
MGDLNDDYGGKSLKEVAASVEKHSKALESLKGVPHMLKLIMSKVSGPQPQSVFDIPEDAVSDNDDAEFQALLQDLNKDPNPPSTCPDEKGAHECL